MKLHYDKWSRDVLKANLQLNGVAQVGAELLAQIEQTPFRGKHYSLGSLIKNGLVRFDAGAYVITPRGREWLGRLREVGLVAQNPDFSCQSSHVIA